MRLGNVGDLLSVEDWRGDSKPFGDLRELVPVRLGDRNAGGGSFSKNPTFGISGELDRIDSFGARAIARITRKRGRLVDPMLSAGERGRLKNDEQDVVAFGDRRSLGTGSSAGQTGRENVERETEAEPFVRLRSADRQNRAERRLIQDGWVVRRLALMVKQPTVGNRSFIVDVMDANLALGGGACAEIEDDRITLGRRADAERRA